MTNEHRVAERDACMHRAGVTNSVSVSRVLTTRARAYRLDHR